MTIKSLLSTVSLALLIEAHPPPRRHRSRSDISRTIPAPLLMSHDYGQAVADTFAWVNKNGGVGGKPLNVDTNDYG